MSEEDENQNDQNIQKQQEIKYGSIISISHFQDNNSFISADGHINNYAYLYNFGEDSRIKQQKMEQSRKKENKKSKQSKSNLYTKFNFSNTLFVIFPKGTNKDKMKILEKLNLDSDEIYNQDEQKSIPPLQSEEIEPLKNDLLKEYYSNFENFKKSSFGLPVNYNQSVQLMHLNSAKFLACKPIEAQHQKEKFQVSLDDYTSENTIFKFAQSFNYQKDGDQVIFANEITYIERFIPLQNKPTYLHSSQEINKLQNQQESQSGLFPTIQTSNLNLSRRPEKQKEEFNKREINGTNSDDSTAWKLNLFNQYPIEQTDQIFAGDIVWLHHSELNSIIASRRIDKGVDKYNFSSLNLSKWLDLDNLELNLNQSQTGDEFSDYSGNTFGMWIIQCKSQQEGGDLVFEKEYRLRHMSSGCFLAVKKVTPENNEEQGQYPHQQNTRKHQPSSQYKLCLTPAADQSTLFTFEQLQTDKMKNQKNNINNGQFTFIKHVQSEKYVNINPNSSQQSQYTPGLQNQRQDNQLFRLYKAGQEEVWEVNFILSTFRCLTSFALALEKLSVQNEQDEANMNQLTKKINKTQKCIQMLTDFVINKLGNSQPEQVFGSVNSKRQKLIQEQYFIEVLVKILEDALSKSELERWEELNEVAKIKQNQVLTSQDKKQLKKKLKDGRIDEHELFNFYNDKIKLCKQIYILLQRTADDNSKNQELIFTYLPFFQIHAKYIPEACACMADIVSKNENLLFNLSVSIKINFDHKKQKIVEKSENNTVKFLINLHDGNQYDKREEVRKEQHINFRQHEKLIVKPVNLIQFFMNLIWDAGEDLKLFLKNHNKNSHDLPQIPNNIKSYLDFLSAICRFEDKGISLNQEIIYKFYKTYSSVRKVLSVKYFDDQYINLLGNKPEQVESLKSLMKFYSDLAYGRNFLWKDYLQEKFNEKQIYNQIWDSSSDINRFQLSANYCNLIQSLFIDHDPLVQVNSPNYCRLFIESNQSNNLISINNEKTTNLKILSEKLQDYLLDFNIKIINYVSQIALINNNQSQNSQNLRHSQLNSVINLKQPIKEEEKLDFLKDELLKNTLYLISKLNQLNVLKILGLSSHTNDYLPKLLRSLLTMLQYNKNNLKFVSAIYNSSEKIVNQKIKIKREQSAQVLGGLTSGLTSKFTGISSFLKKKEPEKDQKDLNNDTFKIDKADMMDPEMFKNPFMRGFIKLNNQLEDIVHEDSYQIQTELEIKKTICKMLSNFIDQRQDFLMQNALCWFKDNISVVTENNKDKLQEVTQKLVENIIPAVGKTGIISIDDEFQKKQKEKYKNMKLYLYKKDNHQVPIFYDLDTILSRNLLSDNKSDIQKDADDGNPVQSVLPKLLTNFFLVTDENLKQMVLKVILRLFNQRLELQNNLNKMLVLFEKEKIVIYKQCEIKIRQLKQKIEKSEIWLAGLGGNNEESNKDSLIEVREISEILKTLKNAFYKETYISKEANGDFKICMLENNQLEVDEDKQQILRYLNLQNIIMQLINDGVPHAANFIMDSNVNIIVKEEIIFMFTLAHQVLQTFVQGNPENQKSMIGECTNLLRFANYDFGQIKLVCEIYRNNYKLLEKFDRNLLVIFSNLIEDEGRQQHFLEFYEVVQSITQIKDNDTNTQFIFENQLYVLNTFLPIKENAKKEIKLLYADGSEVQNIGLNFEDTSSIEELNFLEKLKEVGFRDTFRDEPFLYHARLLDLILKTTLEQCTEFDDKMSFLEVEKITFNISINKVKKIFSFMYLLQILEAEDDFFVGTNQLSKKEWLEIVQNDEFDPNDMQKHQQIMEAHKLVGYSYIKPYVMNFLRCVHILSDKDFAIESMQDDLGEITFQQMQFARFLDLEARKIEKIKDNKQYTDEYTQYLFMYLISTIIAYIDKYFPNFKQIIQQNKNDDDLRQDQMSIKNFCTVLANNYQKFSGKVVTRQEQRMQKLMSYVKSQDEVEMLSVEKKLTQVTIVNKRLDQDKKYVYEKQEGTKKRRQTFTKLNSAFQKLNVINKIQAKELESQQAKDEAQLINLENKSKETPQDLARNKFYWEESFIGNLIYLDEIDNLIDQERQALADAILNVDKLCDQQFLSQIDPKPSKELILQKLIDFLVNSIEDEQNKQTNIALIKVLIQIINKHDNDKVKKLEMQNLFEKLGAINMILYVISENHKNFDGDLFEHFLIFINSLLDGGNLNNQTAVYNYFIHNKKSEIIFKKFQQYFDKQITSLQAKAKKKKLDKQKRQKKTEDLEEENADQQDEDIFCSEQDITILGEILNFLQNCVENHNLDLQNYLRNQWNHRNKYDMVNAVADLLRTYYRDARTQDMYDNMQKCLDTLSEFIQGPCPENQMAVSESKFFEVFQEIFEPVDKNQVSRSTMSMRTKKSTQGMKSKKSTMGRTKKAIALEEWQIARLQNKCLVLALSLLEKRDVSQDKTIIKQILRHLPINIVEHHLLNIYGQFIRQYKSQYKQECLSHLDEEDPQMDQDLDEEDQNQNKGCCKKIKEKIIDALKDSFQILFQVLGLVDDKITPQEKYAFILQNGFYLFFIFSYYMESGERIEGNIVTEYRAKQKAIVSNKKNFLQKFLDADNIVSQIFKLAWTIAAQIFERLDYVRIQILEKSLKSPDKQTQEQKKILNKKKMEEKKKMLKSTLKFFYKNTAHIDIVRDDQLEQIFFIKLPYTLFMPKEKKTEFNNNVSRTNLKSKVEGLVEKSYEYIEICKHEEYLNSFFQKNKFLAIFANYVKLWKDLAFILTLLLNVFILLSYSSVFPDDDGSFDDSRMHEPRLFMMNSMTAKQTKTFFFIFGLMMSLCSMFVVGFFLIKNLPLVIQKVMKKDKTKGQLFLTYILFIIVLYIFTLVGYQFLRKDYLGECEDLFWCFMLMLDYTFKSNGGIGGFLDDSRAGALEEQGLDNTEDYKFLRFIFDTLFNLIIVIILVNIVSGIIIDTFGQLREEETKKLEDIEDKCFICGNKKTEFDRQSQGGFNQHIRINHYMWNYMFYIAYLDWKTKNDYTGVESYIYEKLQAKDCNWFPLNKARELQNLDEKLKQQQIETFNNLQGDINGLIKDTGTVQKKFLLQMQYEQKY
ncbi:MIR motif [Pseudocohnilembus persalinus]|uniref:MIR motif n=1 Tax=Pseudocohnilembus persalinus TaxID=266149 RepID=A0A0V0Q9G8_PSEPJ|nr:MIR motif [Pseudocohnilembus persalinus]|eukprot:KRW98864.1 MIR motif [Pseudocohnilembus persalinus]